MTRNQRIAATLAVAALVVIAALSLRSTFRRSGELIEARQGDLVEAVYGLGTVTPRRSFQVKLGVTSRIRRLPVTEGQKVEKGSTLVEFDDGGAFRAPFSGTVTALPFKEGENVYPQVPILTLMDLGDRYVAVSLEQEGALRIRVGQQARLSFDSLRGRSFDGKVTALFPSDGQFLVHIEVPAGLPPEILPGMTCDTAIEVARRTGVLLVPAAAVQGGRIRVERGGRMRRETVSLGAVDGRWAEVLSGEIKAGDKVEIPRGR
jgi:macrolide-specific efflux system membrane fusion protein